MQQHVEELPDLARGGVVGRNRQILSLHAFAVGAYLQHPPGVAVALDDEMIEPISVESKAHSAADAPRGRGVKRRSGDECSTVVEASRPPTSVDSPEASAQR